MSNIKRDGRYPVLDRDPVPDQDWPDDEFNELSIAQAEGFEQASREIVQTTLRLWACRGNNPDDKIIRFLAQLTKEVLTGEIRVNQEIPF